MTRAQTAHVKKAFLETFRETGNVSLSCARAGAPRREVYRWLEADASFAEDYREAETHAVELMEAEAHRRAVKGLRRLKFDKGVAILDPATGEPYTELEYSDTLLIFLLKAHAPDKYRERTQVDANVALSGALSITPWSPAA